MNTVIITDKMLHGGMASGKIDGKTVFIEGALPQEEISITIVQEKKDYSIASIESILSPSPRRTAPSCPLYGICGGCNLMHAEDTYQRQLRSSILQDAFRREGLEVSTESVSGKSFAYRNRFQFESSGLKSAKSSTIIPIPFCPVADKEVNRFLMNEKISGKVKVFGSSTIVNSEKGYVFAQEQETAIPQVQMRRGKKIRSGGKRNIYTGTKVEQAHEVAVQILNKELIFDVRGFFQSNIEMLEKTAQIITTYIRDGMKILDMYGGAGTLSALCAEKAAHITLVEHNRDAVVYAEQNLQQTKHSSYGLSGAQWISSSSDKYFDAVIIDPPRSGMEKEVRQFLAHSSIPLIVSLSCDPVTHARDCAELVKNGYTIETLYALDYYPQTSHIESLAICIKK